MIVMSDTKQKSIVSQNVCPTLLSQMGDKTINIPIFCYTIDEKMGQTYVHEDIANTLAARDYKQPQAVIYGKDNT